MCVGGVTLSTHEVNIHVGWCDLLYVQMCLYVYVVHVGLRTFIYIYIYIQSNLPQRPLLLNDHLP